MKNKITSLILCLVTAAIWGFAFVFQVQGMDHIGPFTLIGVRFLLSAVCLIPVIILAKRRFENREAKKKTVKASLVAGVIIFAASAFQQFGILITASAGISGFITGLYTVLVPIACYVLFKKKTGVTVVIGALLAVAGLFLLCYHPETGLRFGLGEVMLLVGALLWTAHVIVIDKMGKDINSLHLSWGQFAVCAVLGLVAMFIFEEPNMADIMNAKWPILYCGVLSSAVAYTLQIVAQKRSDPAVAAILLSTESMFSVIGGRLFGIDHISLLGYCGCALMFAGIIVSQIEISKKKNKLPLE